MRVPVTDQVIDYAMQHSIRPDPVLTSLITRTRDEASSVAGMQVAPEQGALLTVLTRLAQARFAVEVGTFTGYSSVCIARGLQPGGRLLCLDQSEEWTDIARDAWRSAGIEDRVELVLGDAHEELAALPADPLVDLAFVDADKVGYWRYFEALLPHVRPGGLLIFDNVLFGGNVLDDAHGGNGAALREFNKRLTDDDRVDVALLTIADGVSLAVKR
jgi:caffeoyl-CoA O-methyltransferase